MSHLPDPRRYSGASVADELLQLARGAAAADLSAQPGVAIELSRAIGRCLEQGDGARLQRVFAAADDAATYRALHRALARSIDIPADSPHGAIARSFAIPIVFVTAASTPVRLPGRLADVEPLRELFVRSNALGPTRNFGLSNALCGLNAIEALSPIALYRSARDMDRDVIGAALPPEDIVLAPNREQTHLRFLVGAGITATDAPGFTETAANMGVWGREMASRLHAQLAVSGVQLLALPRPPKDLVSAPHAGRHAQLETALNLFASNAVRRLRLAVGDPVVIVSAHQGGEVRVTLSSPFTPDAVEGYAWPTHPLDDLAALEKMVCDLFADMGVLDVRIAPRVLEARRPNGAPLYPRCDEWEVLCAHPRVQ